MINRKTNINKNQSNNDSRQDLPMFDTNTDLEDMKWQIAKLHNSSVETVFQIEMLSILVIPSIEANAYVKTWPWEHKLLLAKIASERARLLYGQQKARGNGIIDDRAIAYMEKRLRPLFKREGMGMVKYHEAFEAITLANNFANQDDETSEASKSLFCEIISRLHPEFCLDDFVGPYFYGLAKKSFARGEVESLRTFEEVSRIIPHETLDFHQFLDADELEIELEMQKRRLAFLKRKLDNLKSFLPDRIEDDDTEENFNARRIKRRIEREWIKAANYNEMLEKMTSDEP
jgi:hypothetical protein